MGFFSFIAQAFHEGGVWMWVIFAFHISSVSIIIERLIALYAKRKVGAKAFVATYESDIKRGHLKEVIEKARSQVSAHPVSRAVEAGAQAAYNFGGHDEIRGKMDEVLLEENGFLEKRIGFLAMLGNVATLVGLLGTISGMIRSFAAVSNASPMEKATLLAGGISEAMNATAYGLIVAIPALVMFAVIQNRANVLTEDMNQGALKIFNWLSYSYEAVPAKKNVTPEKSPVRERNEIEAQA